MLGQGYHGGIPPTLDNIEDKDKVKEVELFVSSYMAAPPRQNRRRNPTRGGKGPACATKNKID